MPSLIEVDPVVPQRKRHGPSNSFYGKLLCAIGLIERHWSFCRGFRRYVGAPSFHIYRYINIIFGINICIQTIRMNKLDFMFVKCILCLYIQYHMRIGGGGGYGSCIRPLWILKRNYYFFLLYIDKKCNEKKQKQKKQIYKNLFFPIFVRFLCLYTVITLRLQTFFSKFSTPPPLFVSSTPHWFI